MNKCCEYDDDVDDDEFHPFCRWVGSLVPAEWIEGSEYMLADDDLAVGDLVVTTRSDGTKRFGEVISLDSDRICKVSLSTHAHGTHAQTHTRTHTADGVSVK
jgi:hypothetical protein